MKRLTVVAGLMLLFSGAFAAFDLASQSPSPQAPQRIISLVPSVTEMLFAVGAGPQVVGVSSYDNYPAEVRNRPRVGALIDPDFERILSLKPDLVVVYGTQDDVISRLGRVNIPIFNYQHAGLADITTTIRALGRRVGHVTEADRIADTVDRDLDRIRRAVAGRPRPKTALIFGREAGTLRSIFVSAGLGFLHDILVVAGGDDAFADVGRQSLQVSTEVMLTRAPEVIIEIYPSTGWTADRLARERAVWQGLPALPAQRTGRVYLLADDRLATPGPRVAESARLIAQVLHPDAF